MHRSLITLVLGGALAFAVPSIHAQVASFDCGKASSATEKAICTSPTLGRKDIVVATYYDLLLRLKPATAGMAYREFDDSVRDGQRTWLQTGRNACGGDVACLGRAYDARIAALLKTLDGNAALTFGRTGQ